jgi:small-conductance mechanosensitive channel
MENDLQNVFENLIGEYGWLLAAGITALFFKNLIANIFAGMMFLFGSDFDVDDIVYISGNKKARIIRQTLFKTVFHLIETDRKLVIPNTSLYGLKLEKVLPGANNGKEL